jgi:phosphate transport system substrate-binding protein
MILILAGSSAVAAERIGINGSTTVLPISQAIAEAYMDENPNVNISISGGGSGNGIKALVDQMTDIAQSSRWIKHSEIENAVKNGNYPVPFAIAHDAIIPVVHPDNPVDNLSLDQLKAIYEGKVRNWKDVGGEDRDIVIISRDSDSGTYVVWNEVVLKGSRVSPRAQLLPSNGAITQTISGNRNAIGYIGIGYLNDNLKSITVDGIKPSPETTISGEFPVSRTLWLFTNGWPKGETLRFINFALHPDKGQKLVEKTGYIPLY